MSKIISVDFKKAKQFPEEIKSDWFFSGCNDKKHYIAFEVYKTDSRFAVQFCDGLSKKYELKPHEFSKSKPHYFRNKENLWKYITENLENHNVNNKVFQRMIMKNRIKENSVCIH